MSAWSARALQLLGAGGVGYVGHEYLPKDWVERQMEVFFGGSRELRGTGELTKVLSQLGTKLDTLANRPETTAAPTIVVRDANGSQSLTFRNVVVALALTGTLYAYLRFWRGLRLDDFRLATQGSLRDVAASFSGSVENVRTAVASVRSALAERIERVKDTVAKIREEVSRVHDDVRDVKTDVDATRNLAESCDRRLEENSAKQDYANRGIQALCAVVGELLSGARSSPAIDNLRHFTMLRGSQQQPLDGATTTSTASSGQGLLPPSSDDDPVPLITEDHLRAVSQAVNANPFLADGPPLADQGEHRPPSPDPPPPLPVS
mmetsp:Transcript_8251/g.25505  ORF Transcript_8251/g.25505 Transcript_8251/m.25505 type:complete len:320 (-) Transcript_8251:1012-1971(-)